MNIEEFLKKYNLSMDVVGSLPFNLTTKGNQDLMLSHTGDLGTDLNVRSYHVMNNETGASYIYDKMSEKEFVERLVKDFDLKI